MRDVLIGIPAAVDDAVYGLAPDDPNYQRRPYPSVLAREWGDQRCYLWTTEVQAGGSRSDATDWPPEAYLMGAWHTDGSWDDGYTLHPDLWPHVMRFRNDSDGSATDIRSVMHWQGHAEKKAMNLDGDRYPIERRPFSIRMTRYYEPGTAWPGWYWKAEVISDDPVRDVTARAIGIYDENWNYQFTTGAFARDPETLLFTTVCPAGFQTADPDPIYYALLEGSAQEGRMVLEDPADGAVLIKQFWAD